MLLYFIRHGDPCYDPDCLTPQTRDALNRYHERVFEEIAPLLNEEERIWLRKQTQPI